MKSWAQWLLRNALFTALFSLFCGGIGLFYSIKLYQNLRTDLEELLPTTARSVLDLDEVTQRLESIDNLAVLVFSKNKTASKNFVDDLATELKKTPKDVITSVEYKITDELKFFQDRRLIYMDLTDLVLIRNYVRDRLEYEKSLYNPLNIFSSKEVPEPKLDFAALKKKYDSKSSNFTRFPNGYYATPNEQKRVILLYKPGKSTGIQSILNLKKAVADALIKVNPKKYADDIELRFTGGVQDTFEEQEALVEDLELSTIIVIFLISFGMWYYFKTFRATSALLISLFVGTFLTFGAAYFSIGYLNANSAFLGSIVIGNGINFGIIFLARYLEELRKNHTHDHAIAVACSQTYTATLTAALAAGLSYGSLMLTGFRGFKQFGEIGLYGMILCWLTTYSTLPALLTLFNQANPIAKPKVMSNKSWLAEITALFISKYAKAIWISSITVSILSIAFVCIFLISHSPKNIIQADLTKLRNKTSMTSGSGYLSFHLDEVFGRYLTPLVILPKDRKTAKEIAARLREIQKEEGKHSLIANVQLLEDFVPADQVTKARVVIEIRELLPPRLRHRIQGSDKKIVDELFRSKLIAVEEVNLPELVLGKFREKNGTLGNLVVVEPPVQDKRLDKAENLIAWIKKIRDSADSVMPGVAVAGTLPISADMISAISQDGPKATLTAFLAVVILIVILFRKIKQISWVMFALVLGVLWLVGCIFLFKIKINFLNFIALPITFGIGVDYGVNIFQRYKEEGDSNILKVIKETGGAVALCSFTTMVGYGSLIVAQNQAFVSFGILSVLGELTCIIAAVFTMPAYLVLRKKKVD